MIRVTLILATVGCVSPVSDDLDEPTDNLGSSQASQTTAEQEDELREALSGGSVDIGEALRNVAWGDGLPFHTVSGGWIFVAVGDESFSLAGDFNAWEPAPMREGPGLSWIEVEVPDAVGAHYKFVVDDEWLADPWARSYDTDEYGEFSYVAPPADEPRYDRWPELQGRGLAPRDVVAWVPGGVGPWPTLYAHDGQNLFDEQAIWGGWRLDEALRDVGSDILVVGVANTMDRMSEYTHTEDLGFASSGDD